MSRAWVLAAVAAALVGLPACGEDERAGATEVRQREALESARGDDRFPSIRAVEPIRVRDGVYDFRVTVSSPYDSPERYADGWRVLTPDGVVLGEKRLGHDHADEQPFTRKQAGVRVPEGVREVVVEGHDQRNGYGGRRARVRLTDR